MIFEIATALELACRANYEFQFVLQARTMEPKHPMEFKHQIESAALVNLIGVLKFIQRTHFDISIILRLHLFVILCLSSY